MAKNVLICICPCVCWFRLNLSPFQSGFSKYPNIKRFYGARGIMICAWLPVCHVCLLNRRLIEVKRGSFELVIFTKIGRWQSGNVIHDSNLAVIMLVIAYIKVWLKLGLCRVQFRQVWTLFGLSGPVVDPDLKSEWCYDGTCSI